MIGYVIYTDGGCRPNPNGYGGAGIHGYKWDTEGANKGIGHNTHVATIHGYSLKSEAEDWFSQFKKNTKEDVIDELQIIADHPAAKIMPVQYFDLFKPIELGASNNTAELIAATTALEHFADQILADDAKIVILRVDALYVVNNFNSSLHRWLQNGFRTEGGDPVKNEDLWRLLDSVAKRYEQNGISLIFKHVKGHGECIGNNSADWLATMGVHTSRKLGVREGSDFSVVSTESQADGYWKSPGEKRHPFLSHRYEYYNTQEAAEFDEICMSNQGKDRDLIAKRTSDGAVALVQIKEVDPLIQVVREFQKAIPSQTDYIVKHDLDALYDRGYRYLRLFKGQYLARGGKNYMGAKTCDDTQLTEALMPPFLAGRMVESMDILRDILQKQQQGDETVTVTDITATFFDIQEEDVRVKKGEEPCKKLTYKLRADIPVGHMVHVVEADYKAADGSIAQAPLRLTMGVDTMDRNSIRKLEDLAPKISVVTWKMGADVFLYATVIEAGEDIGIWAGMHSNMRVIRSAEKSSKAKK